LAQRSLKPAENAEAEAAILLMVAAPIVAAGAVKAGAIVVAKAFVTVVIAAMDATAVMVAIAIAAINGNCLAYRENRKLFAFDLVLSQRGSSSHA
jgi:hypothetical protein